MSGNREVDNRDLAAYVEYLEARIETMKKRIRELELQQGVMLQTVAVAGFECSHIDD